MKVSKNDFIKYEANQVYMMKDGTVLFIVDVEPESKFKTTEKDRVIYYYKGHKHVKGEEFSNDKLVFVACPELASFASGDTTFAIDSSKQYKCYISEFRQSEVMYIGKLKKSKLEDLSRKIGV